MATKQRKQHDYSKGITHRLEHRLVLHRPTNRIPTTPTHHHLLRSATQKGGQIMNIIREIAQGLRPELANFAGIVSGTCDSTNDGIWLWYCDEHDTHGNAESEEEADVLGHAHQMYQYEKMLESINDDPTCEWFDPDLCDYDVFRKGITD